MHKKNITISSSAVGFSIKSLTTHSNLSSVAFAFLFSAFLFSTVLIFLVSNFTFSSFAYAEQATTPFKVGLVLDKGGKDDKSFNSSAYEGATKAEKDLGIELKYVEATDNNSLEVLHRNFAQKNYDLVVGVGFAQTDAIKKVSELFPKIHFAIVDGDVKAENVRSLLFAEHEGAFMAGAAASMKTKSGVIGFIGGMDIPLIRRFQKGYEAGAKIVDPKVKVITNYVGVTSEAWNNPTKAKEMTLSQIGRKADVIFHAAGASGSGVFDAAAEKKVYAIGVDSNQNAIKPGVVLTSMMKRVNLAVYDTIKSAQSGQFKSGAVYYSLKDNGVDLAFDSNNEKLWTSAQRKMLDNIRQQIIKGQVQVPDYYKTK